MRGCKLALETTPRRSLSAVTAAWGQNLLLGTPYLDAIPSGLRQELLVEAGHHAGCLNIAAYLGRQLGRCLAHLSVAGARLQHLSQDE